MPNQAGISRNTRNILRLEKSRRKAIREGDKALVTTIDKEIKKYRKLLAEAWGEK